MKFFIVSLFALCACGVDSPMVGGGGGNPNLDDSQSCEMTSDCDQGVCDLQSHTCVVTDSDLGKGDGTGTGSGSGSGSSDPTDGSTGSTDDGTGKGHGHHHAN